MRRVAVAALVVAVAIVWLPAGAAAEPTCTDTWTGGAGDGLWQSAGNWSAASVPGSSDVACIGSGTSVQVTTGSDRAGVLEDSGSLTISGGSLELASSSSPSSVASLSLQGGALTGAGSLDVSGSLSWSKAATMSGAGSTVLQSGASGTIELAAGEKATLEGRALVNEGTLTFAIGTIAISASARIENPGTFKANSETTSYGSQIEVPSGSEGVAPTFVNTGTFEKTAGTGTTTIGVVFEQNGTVTAHTGHFSFAAGEVQQAPQGSWAGSVGSAGYVLAGWDGSSEDSSYLPGVTMSLLQGSRFSWAQETSETRALEGPAGSLRNAGTFYSESEVKVRLSFVSSYSGDLHLYAVDWDSTARRESITVDDGSGSRTVPLDSNFHEGAWVSLPISVAAAGTVTITVDHLAGSNAVLSGIFLGDEGTPPGPAVTSEPQGDWSGHVGSAGYLLPDWDGSQDVSNMPYVTPDLVQGSRYRWEPESSDTRALEGPGGSSLRNASTFYDSNQVQLHLSFGKAYTGDVHLYAVDWNTTERRELITVDGQTAYLSSDFHEGAWVSFPISVAAAGTMTITVDRLAGSNAVLSGIFLGDEGTPLAMPVVSAPKGDWVGAFGTNGYDLFAWNEATDLASLPDETVSLAQGSRYRWTSSTTETQALESPEGTVRKAAALYDSNQLKLQLEFTAAYAGELNLYALDWDHEGRRELITVDGQTAALSSDFSKGAWVSFPVSVAASGVVPISVDRVAGSNAVLSGIFLGTVVPPTNTVAPSISGTVRDGQTLSASTGMWEGTEPLSYSYQWQSCNTGGGECTNIEGATGQTYTLGSGDLETTLRVVVTAANLRASAQATSAASTEVEPGAPSEIEAPSVSGTPDQGETLQADAGTWGGTEIETGYQWERCNATGGECAAIAGATEAAYELQAGDVGKTLRVRVAASNALGSLTAVSPVTEAIGSTATLANTWAPSISGTPQRGHTLTANAGSWLGEAAIEYAYQWQSCDGYDSACEDITGATSSSYTLEAADVGKTLRVRVSASETSGTVSQTSAATQPVAGEGAPVSEAPPTIAGTGLVGYTLTASNGGWSVTGALAYTYEWKRCDETGESCTTISGAASATYTLIESDSGHTVRAHVTATHESASTTAASSATAVISPTTLVDVSAPSITGTYELDRALSADQGIWTGAGAIAYTYAWERCNEHGESCGAITGATSSSYTPGESDVGHTFKVKVTASGTAGTGSVTSAATPVIVSTPIPPEDLFAPSIEGDLTAGDTVTAEPGTWLSTKTISYSYQWQKCDEEGEECVNISGATASTYTLIEGDIGSTLRVVVTASNSLGSASATSYQSETVGAPGPPAIDGEGPAVHGTTQVGQSVVVEIGQWSGSRPLTYTYRWERCNSSGESCATIEHATKAGYTVTSEDAGHTLRVGVTATNALASATARSATAAVSATGEASTTPALELAQETDPSVLAPAETATLEEQAVKPQIANYGELIATNTALTSSTLSRETAGEFTVNTAVGELSLQPLESSPSATTTPLIINGATALYAETEKATDTFVRPTPLGATTLLQLRSAQAPASFSWEVGLGSDQELELLPDGNVAVIEPSSGPDLESELPTEGIEPPEAESAETPTEEGQSKEDAETELESGLSGEEPLEKLAAAPETTTPEVSPRSGELHPQDSKAQYERANESMASAATETGDTTIMVIQAPRVVDAEGNSVPATLSVEGNTVTLAITTSKVAKWPATAELAIGAPTDEVSATKEPSGQYGFADPNESTFGVEGKAEVGGKEKPVWSDNLDPKLKSGPLHVKRARLFLNYNAKSDDPHLNRWLKAVGAAGLTPMITFKRCEPYPGSNPCPHNEVQEYRQDVKALIKALINGGPGRPPVRYWGSWNEPDNPKTALHIFPRGARKAAYLWGETQRAAEEAGCKHHCTVVAGEFQEYANDRKYIATYQETILAAERKHEFPVEVKPTTWGLHDYQDLAHIKVAVEKGHDVLPTYANPEAQGFVDATKHLFHHAKVWATEQGVLLQNSKTETVLYLHPELQRVSAQDFLRLGRPSEHIEWAYYYLYHGPSEARLEVPKRQHEFDSALLPGAGVTKEGSKSAEDPRQAYCVLALGLEGCPSTSETQATISTTITPSAATVLLDVNPEGLATKYMIEYGTTEAYGKITAVSAVANENGEQSETVALSGLEPCTTYHYQAEAENLANEEEKIPGLGGDRKFKTEGCGATDYSGGRFHSCASLLSGSIVCWGENPGGQLGDGTRENRETPVHVSGITNAMAVAAGANSTCALLSEGDVKCWGENGRGQLGDGTTTERLTPVSASGLTDATAIAAGNHFACAVATGGVECWGTNEDGQLGSEAVEESSTPVTVSGITDATSVAAGNGSACALISDGSVKCWGANNHAQLGDGTTEESSTPVTVSGITDATTVTVGEGYACARLSTGSLDCWGELTGDTGTLEESSVPVEVSAITGAVAVTAAEFFHTCTVLSDGSVDCWGANEWGQLGNGMSEYSPVPVAVEDLSGPVAATGGGDSYSCALLVNGRIECWGYNGQGELGDGTTENSLHPKAVSGIE